MSFWATPPVRLEPESHRYFDGAGIEYKSVSALLKQMFPFDAKMTALKVIIDRRSRYFGRDLQDVLDEWEKSAVEGHEFHAMVEDWINGGTSSTKATLSPYYNSFVRFTNGKWRYPLHAETVLWDGLLLIAGTADLIEERPDRLRLWDIKTCRKLGEEKLLKYSIQLELYRRMLAELTGKVVDIGGIIWMADLVAQKDVQPQIIRTVECQAQVEQLREMRRHELTKRHDEIPTTTTEGALV